MILDDLLYLADAQASTTSVASTNVIDTVAKGESYEGAWAVVRVDTAYVDAETNSRNVFQIQTSSAEDFLTGSVTLAQSASLAATDLVAGYMWKIRIPVGVKRYLRVYKSTTNTSLFGFSAGKFDAFIVKDVDMNNTDQLA